MQSCDSENETECGIINRYSQTNIQSPNQYQHIHICVEARPPTQTQTNTRLFGARRRRTDGTRSGFGKEEKPTHLMFVNIHLSLKHGEMRSQLRKNIIIAFKKNNYIGQQSARSWKKSFRGSQHLPPLICSVNINKTNSAKKKTSKNVFQNVLPPKYRPRKTSAASVISLEPLRCLCCSCVYCQNNEFLLL